MTKSIEKIQNREKEITEADFDWQNKYENTISTAQKGCLSAAHLIKKQVDNPKVFNIGVVAPYGAGKSCAIESFKEYCIPDREKKNICCISVANYNSMLNKRLNEVEKEKQEPSLKKDIESNDFASNDTYSEQEIEKSVLQQILYQETSYKLLDSRFKKLGGFFRVYIIGAVLLLFFISISIFIGLQLLNKEDNIFLIPNKNVRYILCLVFLVINIGIFIFSLLYSLRHNLFRKVKFKEFEIETDKDGSVFNKYLDEIIYRFYKLGIKIVIIEDLDRFNNYHIFAKLKELSTLVNSNNLIKHKCKKITFIYAVRDKLFTDPEERSKFFDAIIPIIPVLSDDNSYDIVWSRINDEKKGFKSHKLNPYMVNAMIPYMSNPRIVTNIFNDYLIYFNELKCDPSNYNQLFALMVLKNVRAIEFENLQTHNNSLILKSFNEFKNTTLDSIYKLKKQEIKSYKENIEEIENKIKQGTYEEIKVLKKVFYAAICEFTNSTSNGNMVTWYDDSFSTFENLKEVEIDVYNFWNGTKRKNKCILENLEETIFKEKGYFYKHEFKYKDKLNAEKEEKLNLILDIMKEINDDKNLTFSELSNKYSEFLTPTQDEFLNLVLTNGYIKEDYYVCISKSSNQAISSEDAKIINQINNRKTIGINQVIENPEYVIKNIMPERFGTKFILNYDLITAIYKTNDAWLNTCKENFKSCINNNCNEMITLVSESDLEDDKKSNLFNIFIRSNKSVWDEVWKKYSTPFNDSILTNTLVDLFPKLISLNDNGNVSKYFSNTLLFDFDKLTPMQLDKISTKYQFKIKDITKVKKINLLKKIIDCNIYDINYANVSHILESFYDYQSDDVKSKNYAVLKSCNDEYFKSCVLSDFNKYIQIIYNRDCSFNLEPQLINELLMNDDISIENKILIIKKENNVARYDKNLKPDVLIELLRLNKIDFCNKDDYLDLLNIPDKIILNDYIKESNCIFKIGKELNSEKFKNLKYYFLRYFDASNSIDLFDNHSIKISKIEKNPQNHNLLLSKNKIEYQIDEINSINESGCLKAYVSHFKKEIIDDMIKGVYSLENDYPKIIKSGSINSKDIKKVIDKLSDEKFDELINLNKDDNKLMDSFNKANIGEERKNKLPILKPVDLF